MIHAGALSTLGPVLAKQGDLGERGWGLILSAEAVGLLLTTVVMIRVPLRRPLLLGMLGMAVEGVLILMLGLEPGLAVLLVLAVFAGIGVEVFSLGWNLAMQEHVPDEMLSRAYSYDMLGSFVAIPIGPLVFGPLGAAFGVAEVIMVGGLVYLALALLALISRLGARPRPRQHHFSASARMTRRLRLVATPSAFSTSTLVSRAWW